MNASFKSRLSGLAMELERALAQVAPRVLETYPLSSYVLHLQRSDGHQGYRDVSPEIGRQCHAIETAFGLQALEIYHKRVLVWLIDSHEERLTRHRIPASITSLIPGEFDRILLTMASVQEGYYLHRNDLFAKDLALCRLKLLPCGSEVIDQWAGIPRSTLWRDGLSQLISGALFVMRLGAFRPLYESHWDRRLVRRFTAPEYDQCYVRIAEMLELHPEVRGMFGSSWWFDPAIDRIAPELRFLTSTPVEHGARVFRIGSDAAAIRDATQFSRKRRALYESGAFTPTRYMLVWARDDMLAWASRARRARPLASA